MTDVLGKVTLAIREAWNDGDTVEFLDIAKAACHAYEQAKKLQALNTDESLGTLDLPDEPFPLEIAAGNRPTPGFIHNDFRALDHIEIVADAREQLLSLVGEGRCSEIRACHVLEHFPYNDTVNVLSLWRRLLVRRGTIHIEVPNARWQATAFLSGEITPEEFVYFAYGEQDYVGNFHFAAFTEDILRGRLEESGFHNVVVTDIGQVLVADATAG